jgi:hypothetical protein
VAAMVTKKYLWQSNETQAKYNRRVREDVKPILGQLYCTF